MTLRLRAWEATRRVYRDISGLPFVRSVQDRVVDVVSKRAPEVRASLSDGQTLRVDLATRGARSLWLRGHFDEVNLEFVLGQTHPGDAFLDVGANVGAYTAAAAARVGSAGLVLAFEPNPHALSLLAGSSEDNGWDNVIVCSFAATRVASALGFQPVRDSGMSHVDESGACQVLGLPVDLVLPTLGEREIGGLKLDVEGHELAALDGMRRLFAERPPRRVLAETHASLGMDHIESLFGFFEDVGYEPVHAGDLRPCCIDDVLAGTWNVGFVRR